MKPRLPTQVTLTAVADNTLYEDTNASAQVSNGAGPNFYVGDSWHQAAGLAIRRGVLQFDLSSIPANATIDSVTLTLHLSKTKAATAETVSLNRLLQNWGEGTSDSTGMGAAATTNDATWLDTFWMPAIRQRGRRRAAPSRPRSAPARRWPTPWDSIRGPGRAWSPT